MDQNEIQTMIAANLVAKDEYDRLVSDELTDRGNPGPASEQAILAAELVLGRRLPDSYRAFLLVRDGIRYFDGDSHILAVADLTSDWVKDVCADKAELFVEFEDSNPLAKGAIPILIGEDSNALLLWLPDEAGKGMFVEYDSVERIDEYATLFDYIREDTELVEEMVEEESGEAG